MNIDRSLVRNTAYSAGSAAGNSLLMVLIIAAARLLGDESFGVFSYALALTTIFEMLIDLGLNTLMARNVARDRGLTDRYLHNILGWKILLSIGALALLVLTANLMHQSDEARVATYILGVAVALRSFKATSHAIFQAHERFDLILLTTYIERASLLVFGIGVLVLTHSLIAFALVFALIRIPDVAISFWLVHRKISPVRFRIDRKTVGELQRAAVPFGLYAVVLAAYYQVGTVILSNMRPAVEVGWYSAGYKAYEALTMLPALLAAVLLPRLSRLFTTDPEKHTLLFTYVVRLLLVVSLPLVGVLIILAPNLVTLLYGAEYLPAAPALRVLLIASMLMFTNFILNTTLISANRESSVLAIAARSLVVLVIANVFFVRQFGMIGAAYAVLAGESCLILLLLRGLRTSLPITPHQVLAWRPVLAGVTAGGLLLVWSPGIPASLILFIALYIGILFVFRTFDSSEWSAVKSLFTIGSGITR